MQVSNGAKIRNRCNQVPLLTQDTNGKLTNSQLDTTNESQEASPFPAGEFSNFNRKFCKQISGDPNQTIPSAASDLCLHCLPVSNKLYVRGNIKTVCTRKGNRSIVCISIADKGEIIQKTMDM